MFARRFFTHATAAKGLVLSAVCATAALNLWSPISLTAKAVQGDIGIWMSVFVLCASAIGWADIVWTDAGGRLILPSMPMEMRHRGCVALYASIAGSYGVLAFAALDNSVSTGWILELHYVLMAVFSAVLAASIALEERAL